MPCQAEPLAKKAEISDIRTITRDGQVYLTAVRIKGELVMHRLVPAPDAESMRRTPPLPALR